MRIKSGHILIMPGGESTVISKMLDYNNLRNSIIDIKDKIPIMGVCAGMVLLSKTNTYKNLKTLSIIDFEVERNGYGRQIYSFNSKINFIPSKQTINACFIRANDNINFPGKECVEKRISIEYLPYTKGDSSTQIRKDLQNK